jgi:hypothetical protein
MNIPIHLFGCNSGIEPEFCGQILSNHAQIQ